MLLTFPVNSDLCSTMPHGGIPIKCTWGVLSVSIAPRDITVCPFTASPTCFITPVFVPPVIIHAPVVLAACAKKILRRGWQFKRLLWMQPFYAYFSLLWVHVFEVTNVFTLLWCLVTIKANWSFQVLRKWTLCSHGVNHVYIGLLSISFEKGHNLSGLCTWKI